MHPAERIPGAIGPDHWFPQTWALALSQVAEALDLGGGAGPLEVRVGAADPASWNTWPEPLWHAQTWSLAQNARLWIGCPSSVPRALWQHIGGTEGSETTPEAVETYREILNQSASETATEAASRLGTPTDPSPLEPASAPESGWAVTLLFHTAGRDYAIALAGNVALADALSPVSAPIVKRETEAPAIKVDSPLDPFEMIREVSLELAVSFGDTTMRLADVLKLSSGAIIELNRSVSDPVELLVNDSVIARGDVVVVDGNYGVRITEIVSRRERVRSVL